MSDSLRQAIGNPNDYHHTGVVVKSKDYDFCPCGVKIRHLFEIASADKKFMIGSVCAKRIGVYVGKLCDTCREPNKMRTKHCEDCRKKCHRHNKYHDDNIQHAPMSMNFVNGKHKGKSPDELLGEFDDYLIWVVNQQDWSSQEQRQYIIANLLPKCCQSRFKKYPTTTLAELKSKDPKYFDYMASTDKGCYLNYI